MNSFWRGIASLLVSLVVIQVLFVPQPVEAQVSPNSVPGPDAQNWNWRFRAVPTFDASDPNHQKAQMTFTWQQPLLLNNTVPPEYQIQVASQFAYQQSKKSFPEFCGGNGPEWQLISSLESNWFSDKIKGVEGSGEVSYSPPSPLRFDDARAKGMYFRVVLIGYTIRDLITKVDLEFGESGLFNKTVKQRYPERAQPYIIGCDQTLIKPTTSADPTKDTAHLVKVSVRQKKNKEDVSNGTPVSNAKIFFKKSPGTEGLPPSKLGYPADKSTNFTTGADGTTDTIKIEQNVLGEATGYQITVIHPTLKKGSSPAQESRSFVNDDDRDINIVFYDDGTAEITEETKNAEGVDKNTVLNNGQEQCSKFLGFFSGTFSLNKYVICQMRGLILAVADGLSSAVIRSTRGLPL